MLRPCIIVNLLNFNLFDDVDAYLTRYQLQELTYGKIYTDNADIFTVELPKCKEWIKKQNTQDIKSVNRFCRWLSYLTSSDLELIHRLAEHNRLIQKALMIEKRYTMDDERWYAYEIHEKYLHDQTIRGLLENGISVEIIKKSLKCTDDDINEAKALA